jgi:hypothetical protein
MRLSKSKAGLYAAIRRDRRVRLAGALLLSPEPWGAADGEVAVLNFWR